MPFFDLFGVPAAAAPPAVLPFCRPRQAAGSTQSPGQKPVSRPCPIAPSPSSPRRPSTGPVTVKRDVPIFRTPSRIRERMRTAAAAATFAPPCADGVPGMRFFAKAGRFQHERSPATIHIETPGQGISGGTPSAAPPLPHRTTPTFRASRNDRPNRPIFWTGSRIWDGIPPPAGCFCRTGPLHAF